ncbi:MAG: NACHT domain-containing protein [Candidatus Methylumidiphilus sp.]
MLNPVLMLVVLFCIFLLALLFNQHISDWIGVFLGSDAITLDAPEKRFSIIASGIAIAAVIMKVPSWLYEKLRHKPPTLPPEIVFVQQMPTPNGEALLKAYCQKLRKTCELIDLSLVDTKFFEYARSVESSITLPLVYQEMDVLPCHPSKQDRQDAEDPAQVRGESRTPLLQALAGDTYRRVVLLGDPGSGKSIAMDNLAWLLAGYVIGERDERLPMPLRDSPPVVRVRLRSAALLCRQDGFDLIKAMCHEVCALLEDSGAALWQVLQTPLLDHGVILLDGLDEVPETDGMRADMFDAIDALVKSLGPRARLIITSRPYVFEDTQRYWLDGFASLELQPMDNSQVERFIEHWYRLMRETRRRSVALARRKAHELFVELQDREYLLEPARRPLILTLLVSLHFAREVLPHSRAELYQEAIALMLERWAQRIYRDNPDYPLDEYERKALRESEATRKIALQKLAMSAHRNKQLQISDREIKGLFSDFLPGDCNAGNLLDFIRYRSGILKPGQGSSFEFYHRSFQDYLAALDIAEMDDWQDQIERLLREEGRDWWGEVYLLLVSAKVAGHSKPDAVALLRRFVPEHIDYAGYEAGEWQWLFLSARAVIEQQKPLQNYDNKHYQKLRCDLTAHLLALTERGHDYALPVAVRAEAGRLLGELGDPRPGVTVRCDDSGRPLRFTVDGRETDLPDIVWEVIPGGPDGDFRISRYPVTNAQFACFVDADGYQDERYWLQPPAALDWLRETFGKVDSALSDIRRQPRFWEQRKWNNPNHPVVGISWYEALAFCHWLDASGQYPGHVRLPTEAEWEFAAGGPLGLQYAWGDTADPSLGNYRDTKLGRTSAVGLFPCGKAFAEQGVALYDMSGNVWEWTSSLWDNQEAQRENAELAIRGGSWFDGAGGVRCAYRLRSHPLDRYNFVGFRLLCGVLPGAF